MSWSCWTCNCSSRQLDHDLSIYWGAFLGTEDEVLIFRTDRRMW